MKVVRVQFRRSVLSSIHQSSIVRIEVILCGEFNIEIEEIVDRSTVQLFLREFCEEMMENDKTVFVPINCTCKIDKNIFILIFKAPKICGTYQILVEAVSNQCNEIFLPIESAPFLVSSEKVESLPLLTCFRRFNYRRISIIIKEDYGATLGSFIFDSSIIMLDKLDLIIKDRKEGFNVLELGSGCGLLGIALSKVTTGKVFMTDKECQLALLEENIRLNKCENNCFSRVLEWDTSELFFSIISEENISFDLIIAADVLYDKSMVNSLFNLLNKLRDHQKRMNYDNPKIIIAQKIRLESYSDLEIIQKSEESGIKSAEILFKCGSVVIWIFSF